MKVYAVVHGEKHQGGEIERIFSSRKKALTFILDDLQLQYTYIQWHEIHPDYWEGYGLFIGLQAFDTSTGMYIPKPSE